MEENIVVCDRCRKRVAQIYRRTTNQRLCYTCYYDYLVRQVKKNLSTLRNRISPDTYFFVFVHPLFPLESLVLYDIVDYIEKRYLGKVFLIVPEDLDDLERYLDDNVRKSMIVLPLEKRVKEYISKKGVLASWRVYRGLVRRHLSANGYRGVIVFASCMEFLVSTYITGFLLGLDYPVLEASSSFALDDSFYFVNGFYGIPCIELTLISIYRKKELRETIHRINKFVCKKNYEENVALRLLYDTVKEHSMEVLFSILKVPLSIYEVDKVAKCSFCGGSSAKKYCYWCEGLFGKGGE